MKPTMIHAGRAATQSLQSLGRALMLPIAVLPVAALLLRLGQPDLLGLEFVSAAGNAMFSNLGLLFAIGVATGFARDGNGAAPLAGAVCFLTATEGAKALLAIPPEVTASATSDAVRTALCAAWTQAQIGRLAVPVGIVSGIVGGSAYNRFATVTLPEYLAFFAGRRFVPIVSGAVGVLLAGLVGASFGAINTGVDTLGHLAVSSGGLGLFVYGVLNRLLLVTGLHHIINNIVWFVLGDYHGVTGDLRRFFAGDPTAGDFMSGFFPVMMFGLPAACLAMYHTAAPERRKATAGVLLSLAATSFLTGVTEPIEFSFMFLAPLLFALHAVLTGISMALMAALKVHLGFGFSAGLFDYVLNFPKAHKPLLLIPVGLAYFAIYYTTFRWAIVRFDLKTLGREDLPVETEETAPRPHAASRAGSPARSRGSAYLAALGGAGNLSLMGACTTRLRLVVARQDGVDEARLRALGAKGVIRPSATALQVVLGPIADTVAEEIRKAARDEVLPETTAPLAADVREEADNGLPVPLVAARLPAPLRTALGSSNAAVWATPSRLIVETDAVLDIPALEALGLRAHVELGERTHLLFAPSTIAAWL